MAQRRFSPPRSSPLDVPNDLLPQRQTARLESDGSPPRTATAGYLFDDAGPRSRISTSPSPSRGPQKQMDEYRETLARDLELHDLPARPLFPAQLHKSRVSPILEEDSSSSALPSANHAATASQPTPSNIDAMTSTTASTATTSSPLPHSRPNREADKAAFSVGLNHRAFLDRSLSDSSNPASHDTFKHPAGSSQPEPFDFPTPSLSHLSLMLNAEPGLDAWWTTVVQIMRDLYKAERVTLSVPADTTDIENVPWGQKATYNEHLDDKFSLAYFVEDSDVAIGSEYDALEEPLIIPSPTDFSARSRPGLSSRHSYTAYEERRREVDLWPRRPTWAQKPAPMIRSKSHLSSEVSAHLKKLDKDALDEHNAADDHQHQSAGAERFASCYPAPGRVLSVLQALDFEADPLIDHAGVMRVIRRGRPVALTRSYPYLPTATTTATTDNFQFKERPNGPKQEFGASGSEPPRKPKKQRSNSLSKLSSIFAGSTRGKAGAGDKANKIASYLEDEDPRPPTPRYEEYEQGPPSPWSQSPAPSPAVRADPKENPFFTDAMVDEDSFNPGSAPPNYTGIRPPEAIGVDNCWTVLHIPLSHVLLSRPAHHFRLDTTAMEQRSRSRSKDDVDSYRKEVSASDRIQPEHKKEKSAPIAILSILSPVIPYPSNLRRSLENLAPHMATSFSLCRHYTNLEIELAGLQQRRPPMAGFGTLVPGRRPVDGGNVAAPKMGESVTSPSEESAISRSATASPLVTPCWEPSLFNQLLEKRQPLGSPASASQGAENYFSSKHRPFPARQEAPGARMPPSPRKAFQDSPSADKKTALSSSASRSILDAAGSDMPSGKWEHEVGQSTLPHLDDSAGSRSRQEVGLDALEALLASRAGEEAPEGASSRHIRHGGHTVLHSYGADFASTFQSLPPSSSLLTKLPTTPSGPPWGAPSSTRVADMPPPSDRLKGLILDSLPAHVFVALPQTGQIVWVNSRFLSYRGLTVADLSADPWGSIHVDDLDSYLKAWAHSLRTGEQFSRTVRIKRFDGAYRWFYARAVASKDKRGVIMQFLGSYMDIHDQHIAELRAARQEEVEASEAKHRLLANLIPQIIFTATEDEGITFANEQWLSYTGQAYDDSLNMGFMDFVHPDDLAKCCFPIEQHGKLPGLRSCADVTKKGDGSSSEETIAPEDARDRASSHDRRIPAHSGCTTSSWNGATKAAGQGSEGELPSPELPGLARKGIIKVATDTSGRLSYTTEVRLRSKTGEYRWHLVRCVEIDTVDFRQGASSYFGSATDINDHKLLEAKLKEAMESKSRFLSNMSHEIRTPLIGISGMVSFLQDTILNEEQRDYTNTIQTSANSLIMIINDILDLSKVDAGMMKLKFEWFHTRSLIEDVNELVSTMAIAKRLELNYLVDADVPAWVKGDKVRIRQVLLNVIGNAIKFTAEGEVFSRCRVHAPKGRGERAGGCEREIMLEFAITDTGRGFSKEEAELIFKPFSQIDGSSTRQYGGSGLGLVISRQLVELHGGTMQGKAELGKGSTFTFTARFALPTAEDHPDLSSSPALTASVSSELDTREGTSRALKPLAAPSQVLHGKPVAKGIPGVVLPSKSENPSGHPAVGAGPRRPAFAGRSSPSSVSTDLARFSEAAKASGQDLSQMKLEVTSGTADSGSPGEPTMADPRPPMYSILIICPQFHSREATTQHIEMILPKDVPHQISALATVEEAQRFIGGEEPIRFTHIVLNLSSAEAILGVMDQMTQSRKGERLTILILCDSVQRQAVARLASEKKREDLLSDNLVTFIYKPVKPSRFAVIFDPDKVRDVSTDLNRSTAQQMVESQKASYQDIGKRMGNKGYKVLLVEDNPVNQKVLIKYLKKIGVDVDVAVDGVECTDRVLSKPHQHYSLILCDLHMPRKDGYQACREIRQWEREGNFSEMPIIALSANVMSDVQDKCIAAGFSDYVAKPVDFIDLSRAMAKFF